MFRVVSVVFSLIFGGVFSGVGIFILLQTSVPMVQTWYEAREWIPVQADLITVSGDDSNTTARYNYRINGEMYQSDRVYLAEFSDNIGSYHQRLTSHLNNRIPVTAWVDPDNHRHALLDKEMRWGLLVLTVVFCSVFILIGLFVIYSGFKSKPKHRFTTPSMMAMRREWKARGKQQESFLTFLANRQEQLRQQQRQAGNNSGNSSQNWEKRKGWETAVIRSTAKRGAVSLWVFALIWNGISFSLLFNFLNSWDRQDYAALLVIIFPFAGLFLFYQAFKKGRDYKRYGIIEYEMDPYPGSIGGNIGGTIRINNLKDWDAEYYLEAQCVYSYISGSGKNRSRRESVLWAEKGVAKVSRTSNAVLLGFSFSVPGDEDLPEADTVQQGNYHLWRLRLTAELPGVNIDRSYNIPVFRTGELSKKHFHDISKDVERTRKQEKDELQAALARGEFDQTPLKRAVCIKKLGRGLQLVFPMFRNSGIALFGLIFGVGFSFATYSIVSSFGGAGGWGIMAGLFAIPFGVVAIIGLAVAIYLPFNSLRVRIENRQVRVMRTLFLFPVYYKKVGKHEVTSLSLKKTATSGQGVSKVEHYKILAQMKGGTAMTIAESLEGKEVAEFLKEYLQQKIRSC